MLVCVNLHVYSVIYRKYVHYNSKLKTLCDDPSDDIDDKYFLRPASFQVHDSPEPENCVCPPTCKWYLIFQRRIEADRRNVFRLDSRLEHL